MRQNVEESLAQHADLGHVLLAVGGCVEASGRLEDAPDLGERLRDVGHVVEHVVREHDVERAVRVRQALGAVAVVDDLETFVAEVVLRLAQHRLGEVGERQAPALGDLGAVDQPHGACAATDLEDGGVRRGLHLPEQPRVEVLVLLAVELVERDAVLQSVRGRVLAGSCSGLAGIDDRRPAERKALEVAHALLMLYRFRE